MIVTKPIPLMKEYLSLESRSEKDANHELFESFVFFPSFLRFYLAKRQLQTIYSTPFPPSLQEQWASHNILFGLKSFDIKQTGNSHCYATN